MDEVDKKFFIEKEELAVIVVSSTGDGDPPENAHRFFRKLSRKDLENNFLGNLEYALLGLGDSNYSTFQGAPKKLEKILTNLGAKKILETAKKILETGVADDQVGLELAVEPWTEKLYCFLAKRFGCNSEDQHTAEISPKVFTESLTKLIGEKTADLKMANGDAEQMLPFLEIKPKPFSENEPNLVRGSETLRNEANLRIPVAPQNFIVSAVSHEKMNMSDFKWQNGDRFPGQFSEPIMARVVGQSEISLEGQVHKPKRQLDIFITEESDAASHFLQNCDAGDSVYFIFSNPKNEVDFILDRLSLLPVADNKLTISVDSATEKRDPKIPGYIPSPCSLRYLLTYCLDFRRAPGRPVLRIFAEHAKDEKEKRRLLELAVEPWTEKLYDFLAKRFGCNSEDQHTAEISPKVFTESLTKLIGEKTADLKMANGDGEQLLPFLEIKPKPFSENEPNLVRGSETLRNEANLRIPVAPQNFVVSAVSHEKMNMSDFKWQNGDQGQVHKPKRQLDIFITEESDAASHFLQNCDAGDSVYFIFSNPKNEVDFILDRLSLLPVADNKLTISVDSATEKRDPKIPGYIPSPCSLRYLLTYCLDFRRAPGRPVLRIFAEHAKDEKEKRRLLELCSAQGVQEFTSFVRQAAISLVDLLIAFPSCSPPIDRLIELLPRLIPRPYSVANHQSRSGKRIRFVFSLLNFPAVKGVQFERFGVCSTYLRSLQVGDSVRVILKEPSKFRLPPIAAPQLPILEVPLILIGPGTGVAPFASFFQKLLGRKIAGEVVPDVKRYLFYGSVDLSKEFILKEELESLNREGIITDLVLCESKANNGLPKYVQEALTARGKEIKALTARGKEISDLIFAENSKALIFACGDAKGMSKDLWACFAQIFTDHSGKPAEEIPAILKKLKDDERYIEDVWS
uniref:Methionine synthase reductase n=1 Tax=Panagrolaimus sp. JU765 TaxID=591449 RepID=A0AC34Q9U9_9BILA